MLNRKIAISAVSIFAAFALVAGGTLAFFSDTATSSENTFTTGSMDLRLAVDEGEFSDNLTASFDVDNMAPGQSAARMFKLQNNGSTAISEIALDFSAIPSGPNSGDLRNKLNLKLFAGGTSDGSLCSSGTDVTGPIESAFAPGGVAPLTMFSFHGQHYDSLPFALAPTGTQDLCVQVTMDTSADNTYQGNSANASFSFVAHQDLSQL